MSVIYIGADHAGFDLKEKVVAKLKESGHEVEDLTPAPIDLDDDYPAVAKKVAQAVLANDAKGILLCGSGNGICAAANKIKGIRAAVGYNTQAAKWAREHLDANILCLAGRVLSPDYAQVIVKDWLATPFSNEERHTRRIEQLKKMED